MTHEEHERCSRLAHALSFDPVREVVTRRMTQTEAENECALVLGISIETAVYYVSRAVREDAIGYERGDVFPLPTPSTTR